MFHRIIEPYSQLFGPFVDFGLLHDPHQELFVVRTRPPQEDDHPSDIAYTSTTNTTSTDKNIEEDDHGWHQLFVLDHSAVPMLFRNYCEKILLIGKTQYFRSKIQFLSSGRSQWPTIMSTICQQRLRDEPLFVCVERVLCSPMNASLHRSSMAMMYLLTNVLHLEDHLNKMQNVYMLSNVDMMSSFVNAMFDRVSKQRRIASFNSTSVDENVVVTYWLRRSMASYGTKHTTNSGGSGTGGTTGAAFATRESKEMQLSRWSASFHSSVDIDDTAAVGVLNELTVNYTAPWPLNIVIDRKALLKYNCILRWLLQVKRCKSQLDQLHTTLHRTMQRVRTGQRNNNKHKKKILYKDRNIEQRLHRCCLIIMEFLHFINNIHSYMMDCAVRSEWDTFQEELKQQQQKHQQSKKRNDRNDDNKIQNIQKTRNNKGNTTSSSCCFMSLDDVRARHNKLLDSIMEQCLLNVPNTTARQQVVKILNFSHRVVHTIQEYIHSASSEVMWTTDQDDIQSTRQLQASTDSLLNVHQNFQRTVRFLIVLMKSHVRHSYGGGSVGSCSFARNLLVTIDFSGHYSKKNYTSNSKNT